MTAAASIFCASECGKREVVTADQARGTGMPGTWRIVVIEGRPWAACCDACQQKMTPERMLDLYERRMAQFKIGNAHRRRDD